MSVAVQIFPQANELKVSHIASSGTPFTVVNIGSDAALYFYDAGSATFSWETDFLTLSEFVELIQGRDPDPTEAYRAWRRPTEPVGEEA